MIRIDSDQGRIGELWWINSDPQPIERSVPAVTIIPDLEVMVRARFIRWGTWGLGRNIHIDMEPINDRF